MLCPCLLKHHVFKILFSFDNIEDKAIYSKGMYEHVIEHHIDQLNSFSNRAMKIADLTLANLPGLPGIAR